MGATPRPGDPVITPALVAEHGITPFHRRSFARVRAIAIGEQLELDLPPENLDALLMPELAAVSEG